MKSRGKWILSGTGMLIIAGLVVMGTVVIPDMIRNTISVKKVESFSSWKSLTEATPNIVVGEVGKTVDTANIDGLRFVITEINATTTLKGKMSSTTFNLLQTDVKQDPLVKRGSTVLLFVYPFEGPQTDDKNTYTCKGMNDGQFVIKDAQVKRSYLEAVMYGNQPKELSGEQIWGIDNSADTILATVQSYVAGG